MWKAFLSEIKDRVVSPWSNPPFPLYFALSIVIFGLLGVFFSIYESINYSLNLEFVAHNLGTYFIAILATAFVDLNLDSRKQNVKSLFLFTLICFTVGVFLLFLTYELKNAYSFLPALIGCVLAWLIWTIANAKDERFKEAFDTAMRKETKATHGKDWGDG